MNTPIRVVIVDDHPLYRDGVAFTLNRDPTIQVVGQGASMADAITLIESCRPDVALLDITMPGGGLNALNALAQKHPDVKYVILTASDDEDHVRYALRHGASAYVLKGIRGQELIQVVHDVHQGQTYISPSLAAALVVANYREPNTKPHSLLAEFTPRERDILRCVAKGCSNREIAERLHLSEKTVKHYMTSIMKKMGARNRVEVALQAQELGLGPD